MSLNETETIELPDAENTTAPQFIDMPDADAVTDTQILETTEYVAPSSYVTTGTQAPTLDFYPTTPPATQPETADNQYPPLPERPVNTAPRPLTIVWGFIIMALGVLAMTVASGANIDLSLVLVWLPAICGLALILAAILTALRRTRTNVNQ